MKNIIQKWKVPPSRRKKSYVLLIIGSMLVIVSLILAVYHYHTSYQLAVDAGKELTELKKQIDAVKAGGFGNLDALDARKAALSADKLNNEKPYSYCLALLFFSIILTIKGIWRAIFGVAVTDVAIHGNDAATDGASDDAADAAAAKTPSKKMPVRKLAQAGLLAALCYIGFVIFKIDIPVGPGKTAFHFGNVFLVVAALLLGGYWGGLAGAVGMTIGDLTTVYVTSAPKTFLLKLMIGLITGFVAHTIFRINEPHSDAYVTRATVFAAICGMGFNVVADPVAAYFYKTYLLGVPQDLAAALAKMSAVTSLVNAVVAIIAASAFYLALRPALKKAGML